MSRITRHVLLPLCLALFFFAVGLSPVEILGCRNRGLLALAISLAAGISGLATASLALKGRILKDPDSYWWIITTLILLIPLIALIILA